MHQNHGSIVRLIASKHNWIASEAVTQLHRTAELPGMHAVVGMPDLHPGKGSPIGATFITQGIVYPHLVGNDVGCGMGLWRTDVRSRKLKLDRWVDRLHGLESPWDGDQAGWLAQCGVAAGAYDRSLGTIGSGNHFAELQAVETVHDADTMQQIGLDKERLLLLVHSGSRGLGEALLRVHVDRRGSHGLDIASGEASDYLLQHDHAVEWARANRALIASRFLDAIGGAGERVIDVCHNSVTMRTVGDQNRWLHRKGAAPADQGPVVIPGSRGSRSLLVVPQGDLAGCAWSLAHGAGRKWARRDCKQRLRHRYSPEALARTDSGSRVICEDRNLIYEEAPQAYKNIDVVVQDLVEAGFVRVIATLRPLITYKTRRQE
jgi:release factor H-coupled RctB family protein